MAVRQPKDITSDTELETLLSLNEGVILLLYDEGRRSQNLVPRFTGLAHALDVEELLGFGRSRAGSGIKMLEAHQPQAYPAVVVYVGNQVSSFVSVQDDGQLTQVVKTAAFKMRNG